MGTGGEVVGLSKTFAKKLSKSQNGFSDPKNGILLRSAIFFFENEFLPGPPPVHTK